MLKKISYANKKTFLFAALALLSGILLSFIYFASAATVQDTDLNGDSKVDILDLSTLLSNYGRGALQGDVNKDGQVDIFDLSAMLSNYGKTVGVASCASSTQHVPDGPDGMGGCWPGPTNTGPNAPESNMAQYAGSGTGECYITEPNTIIDSKVVKCDIVVSPSATGLVVKNSYVYGAIVQSSGSTANFSVQDSFINGNDPWACNDCGVGYQNFSLVRTEIIGTNRGAFCEFNCTIENNYIHGTNLEPVVTNLAHASAVRNQQNMTLRHNSLHCDFEGPYPNDELGCSADMSGYPDFAPINNATIDSNLFMANNIGIGYCVYGGASTGKPYSNDPTNATNIKFTNNIFQRGQNGQCGAYGPVTAFDINRSGNEWTNNKYDNGTVVNPSL